MVRSLADRTFQLRPGTGRCGKLNCESKVLEPAAEIMVQTGNLMHGEESVVACGDANIAFRCEYGEVRC